MQVLFIPVVSIAAALAVVLPLVEMIGRAVVTLQGSF
jgi:hypothetical protein